VKPYVVFAQVNENWWRGAKMLKYVKSQEEMNLSFKELSSTSSYKFPDTSRKASFYFRWYLFNVLFRIAYRLPSSWKPHLAGLEVKFALEEAEKLGSKIVFMDHELDAKTWQRLYHEIRFNIQRNAFNYLSKMNSTYYEEFFEFYGQFHNKTITEFVEGACDQYTINWFIQTMEILFPEYKRIFIESKEQDMFRLLMEHKGKRMVAVVNQIHMEGLEHHWCHSYGQKPRNMFHENIDPIGDMELRSLLFDNMCHAMLRDIKTSRSKSTPSSYSNYLSTYDREGNAQYEHRNM